METVLGPRGPKCSEGVFPTPVPRSPQEWEQEWDRDWDQDSGSQACEIAAARPRRPRVAFVASRWATADRSPAPNHGIGGSVCCHPEFFDLERAAGPGWCWTTWSKMTKWVLTGSG